MLFDTISNLQALQDIAQNAGRKILSIYNNPEQASKTTHKEDQSPLTLADTASHEIIKAALSELSPAIPIISEEGKDVPYEEREAYDLFWLVDPLDGTKEFINRNGEFTVNIALIKSGYPIAGFIYVPVTDVSYFGVLGHGAWKVENGKKQKISIRNSSENRTAVRSRSHPSPEEEALFKKYDVSSFESKGSSLKFCVIAEGNADLYYRHGPTMEWDTGAGQAVLEAAGGQVVNIDTMERFRYNKFSLLNGGFLATGFSL